ncbi:hypothetical protein UFOVP1365_11 [uncultured Caudovirales phage]|uniref:Bacteriophage lambda, Stf, side tail fibre-repeat-2 n=1 Tax=uncultured Caudovirales phage TaxID=2100421 RepID=A0A6J5RX35_9CAUD|nr:hypothetical protein UFOVP1365_11 [uncultured Caudovirales phage]
MADTKVSALTAATSVSSEDLFYLVDDPAGTPTSKKVPSSIVEASFALSNLSGTLSIAKGGTGQTTANTALNALLPSQASNSGKVLQTDGTNTSWETGGAGGGYATVQEEGSSVTARTILNFVGAGLTATDDGSSKTLISVDATLNALAAYNTNGLLTQTGADTFTGRTITGTANEITVTNGDGVSGAPTLSIPATIDLGGKTSLEIPNSAAPTVDADGEIAVDTTVADFSHGIVKYFSGEELGVVAMPIAQFTTPTNGRVVAYNSTNDEFELVAASGGTTMLLGYKTADQGTTSATGVDVTSLVFAIGASEVWSAEFTLGMTVSGAAGAKFSVTTPSGATMSASVRGTNAAPGVITTSGTLTAALLTTTNSACTISVLVQNSTNAGNVQCQIASADGIVTATAKGGQCYFTARKIS